MKEAAEVHPKGTDGRKAPFRALFLILNEDRNGYINEHISDTVTIELRCGQAQDLPEKPC